MLYIDEQENAADLEVDVVVASCSGRSSAAAAVADIGDGNDEQGSATAIGTGSGNETINKESSVKQSHLPSWVLKMRSKIDESRLAHAAVELRLAGINKGLGVLTETLNTIVKEKEIVANKIPLTEEQKQANRSNKRNLQTLSPDCFLMIFKFLEVESVAKCEMLSKLMYSIVSTSLYWSLMVLDAWHVTIDHSPAFFHYSRMATHKLSVVRYLNQAATCIRFIRTMKAERAVLKHKEVDPRRHTRSERTVSYPLPLYENTSSRNSRRNNIDLIMSTADSMHSDFRRYTHHALAVMLQITANPEDPITLKLSSEGLITVLISMLTNEDGAIKNFCCEILSNILCWESRMLKRFRKRQLSRSDYAKILFRQRSSMLHRYSSYLQATVVGDNFVPLCDQLRQCSGHKLLAGLLTSPAASINLAGSKGQSTGGFMGTRMVASVQGTSSKQAARALINLFCVAYPVAPTDFNQRDTQELQSVKTSSTATTLANAQTQHDSTAGEEITYAAKLGKQSPSKIVLSPLQSFLGDRISSSSGKASWTATQRSQAPINSMFTAERHPIPWLYSYYYQSGSLKEQFVVYMQFHDDGRVSARGVDSIGIFFMTGKADMDITGWVYFMHKTYISREVALQQLPAGNAGGNSSAASVLRSHPVSNNSTDTYTYTNTAAVATSTTLTASAGGITGYNENDDIPDWVLADMVAMAVSSEPAVAPGSRAFQPPPLPPIGPVASAIADYDEDEDDDGYDVESVPALEVRLPPAVASVLGSASSSIDSSIALWLLLTGDELLLSSSSSSSASSSRNSIHVSHMAYFADGRASISNNVMTQDFSQIGKGRGGGGVSTLHAQWEEDLLMSAALNNDDMDQHMAAATAAFLDNRDNGEEEEEEGVVLSESYSGVWGTGFWGVWEPASNNPHFELQKGGVFRAVPIMVT